MTPRAPSRRTVIGIASGASIALMAVAGTAVASSHHTATVTVDGVSRPFSGFSDTVGAVLAESGVKVGPHDAVSPDPSAALSDGTQVVVRRAHPYSVAAGGHVANVWSTGGSVQAVARDIAASGRDLVVPASRDAQRQALPALGRAGTLVLVVGGEPTRVRVEAGETAPQILSRAEVRVKPIDRVYFAHTPDGVELHVDRVTRGYAETTKRVGFDTRRRSDPNLAQGATRVVREGRPGAQVARFYRETLNGRVTFESSVGNRSSRPVARIVAVGTKKPAATRQARTAVAASSTGASQSAQSRSGQSTQRSSQKAQQGSGQGSAPSGAWARLAQCESGGNAGTNTGNGYYGLYQFSAQTWHAMGGSGLPSDASAAEQTRIAQKLQSQSGWGQWPACSASVGLR